MDLPILVTFHTQSINSRIKVQETLYFANPFKIKFKVTFVNIGVSVVLERDFGGFQAAEIDD